MGIRIVTDSACDLPPEIIRQYNIGVVPLYINIGEKSYLEGVEMSHDHFYNNLDRFSSHPQTASPGPEAFASVYKKVFSQAGDPILAIHVAGSFSAVCKSAQIGADDSGVPVTVHDSRQVALAAGLQVLAAAKAAADGAGIADLLQIVRDLGQRTHLFALLDTLKFLQRSGRISLAALGFGSLLRVKPLLKVYEGVALTEKVTTHIRALQRLVSLAASLGPLEHLSVVHTQASEAARKLYERVSHLVPKNNQPIYQSVTPVVGAHVGPKAVGLVCVVK